MGILSLPSELATPSVISGKVASKVMLDLTVYLAGPSEHELEHLLDLYTSICPPGRLVKYTITELQYWSNIANPDLTASGRKAAITGVRRPYLEPIRRRIRDGRAFEIQLWDGRSIDDSGGSWSFNCQRIRRRSSGLHAFARIIIPLQASLETIRTMAFAIADDIELYSGHGGLAFVYDPWLKEDALDIIYAQARRFWGVDVEDLNGTLPLTKEGIKGVNWITLLGREFISSDEIGSTLSNLTSIPDVTVEQRNHAIILIAGSEPVPGDQHRPDKSLDPYYAVANALKPLFLTHHPDFPSERFIQNGSTTGWIRRFIEPNGWR